MHSTDRIPLTAKINEYKIYNDRNIELNKVTITSG